MQKIAHYQAVCSEIIRLLSEERRRHKLSNYVVSQKSGVSESMLSLVERGLRKPSMEIMLRIADGMDADLAVIIKKAQAMVLKMGK